MGNLEPVKYSFILAFILLITSCGQADYSPKPRGYFRINFPEKSYHQIPNGCPFQFEIPDYASYNDEGINQQHPCWKNIDFPAFNARLHLSYFPISKESTLAQLTEDARTFAFKHSTKATAIDQSKISIPEHKVHGLQYIIGGNTASNYQFYLTDSSKHYLRGALYFNEKPQLDSIQPVLEFIKADIKQLIHSLEWK
ncbi:gliding motility lipoprotein GldD [Sphingobacterium humi]|uniref:gliding motility lipoprotein GldD n=1 Tax=Sphingobacterium humi TaxID=1796905 RepID=UPI001FE5EB19|nr:gliding motility lipoprotein GldD [Sphingobacterium humi]